MTKNDNAYQELVTRISQYRRSGIRLGLDRTQLALARLGQPQRHARCRVIIGGTNGKGSTSRFCEQILVDHGQSVGVFRSPHLVSLTERFSVNGIPVSQDDILQAELATRPVMNRLSLTFFELCTVWAAWLFRKYDIDIAIYEVGMGGRLDSTNAFYSEVSCITGVDYDHMEALGDTLPAIAKEKCGIIKDGQRVVIGVGGRQDSLRLCQEYAKRRNTKSVTVAQAVPQQLVLGLHGGFQKKNAGCAVHIVRQITSGGWILPIGSREQERSLASTKLAGRLQKLPGVPPVWVDGGHNQGAAQEIASWLTKQGPVGAGDTPGQKRIAIVVSVSADKDAAAMARTLSGTLPGTLSSSWGPPRHTTTQNQENNILVIACQYGQERSMDCDTLRAVFLAQGFSGCLSVPRPYEAVETAKKMVGQSGMVLVFGSLYLAAEVLGFSANGSV